MLDEKNINCFRTINKWWIRKDRSCIDPNSSFWCQFNTRNPSSRKIGFQTSFSVNARDIITFDYNFLTNEIATDKAIISLNGVVIQLANIFSSIFVASAESFYQPIEFQSQEGNTEFLID